MTGSRRGINISHGKSYSRTYSIWRNMISRCKYPNHNAYVRYGGKGITVCDQWQTFDGFYKDMGDPPMAHTIDRINNSLGYSKSNCRWATVKEQNNNYGRCHFFIIDGQRYNIMQICEHLGIRYPRLRNRLVLKKMNLLTAIKECLELKAKKGA